MVCFPTRGPRGTWNFVFLCVHIYAREQDEIWKKQFSRVLSHDLYCENKRYKLKRSIREVKHHVTKFVPGDQVSPLQYICRLLFIILTHKYVVSLNFLSTIIVLSSFYFSHFLFCEILNLNLMFAVFSIHKAYRNSLITQKKNEAVYLNTPLWQFFFLIGGIFVIYLSQLISCYYRQASPAG